MSCKDCLHYEMCDCAGEYQYPQGYCKLFKDKSEWVYLPCKIGDKIFMIIESDKHDNFIDEGRVISISYDSAGCWIFARYNCGLKYYHKVRNSDYFFVKEEAEKALVERGKYEICN